MAETATARQPVILVVDDDEVDRKHCCRLLQRELGCTTLIASSCREGLDIFASRQPDLVLLDYNIAGATAIDFLAAIERAAGQPAPVIVLTGAGNEAIAVDVMRHGALDYLAKATDNGPALARAIKSGLEKANMYRELRRKTEALTAAREAAEAANRAKGAFLANVSHEIRTPLSAIVGYAEELLDRSLTDSSREQAAACVLANSDHLLHLINDLLDLSKIEAGKLRISREAVSPLQVAEAACLLLETRAREKGIDLELERLSAVPRTIQTDPTRLRQILFNLLGNAIKFTDAGSVRLTMRFVDGAEPRLEFAVVDSGIGMAAEQLEGLFQPFFQIEQSGRRFGGTGLGLSISRHLTGLLGGEIAVESRPGSGSTFRLTLAIEPVADADLLAQLAEPREVLHAKLDTAGAARPLTGRVLLADDVAANRHLIERILTRHGAEVVTVENGAEAVDRAMPATGAGFDIVLMDMRMPVLDGYAATRKLRSLGYTGPIIALTADAMIEDVERCLEAGCNAHASKPIQRQKLLELLATYLPAAAHQP